MNYEQVESTILHHPASTFEKFTLKAQQAVDAFPNGNRFFNLIDEGNLTLPHSHRLLNTLFHQVYMSSSSFALAGTMLDNRYFKLREYLFHHAEEEQDHWQWIIQNLRDTGYAGADPREVFPSFPTQAYLSFAMYLAHKQPAARLAMAYVLEGISGNFGVHYGTKAARQLKLSKEQMSFFLLHGELDKGHSHDILDVLKDAPLAPYEWAWCEYAAECTLHLYRGMYNHAAQLVNEPVTV